MNPFRVLAVVLSLLVAFLLSPLPRVVEGSSPPGFGPEEAPTGFDNGTNGLVTQTMHDDDRDIFDDVEDESDGLGPVFNGASCAECHSNPVTGGFSNVTELRAGHLDDTNTFVPATARVNFGQDPIPHRSLINMKEICAQAEETLRPIDNIRVLRISLNLLGDGFVEAIEDDTLEEIRLGQPVEMRGERVIIPPTGGEELKSRGFGFQIGRFGWKDQHVGLLAFSSDAYLNEMGISNRLAPNQDDVTHLCDTVQDPEDQNDIDIFTRFIRATKAPSRGSSASTPEALRGETLFTNIGCETCHVSRIVTSNRTITPVGVEQIPEALANKIIHPYSDFLLHKIGTGDGIVQNGAANTRNKVRTAPLWGLRKRTLFLHDGSENTLDGAIQRHGVEAAGVTQQFNGLSAAQRQDVIAFLNSL